MHNTGSKQFNRNYNLYVPAQSGNWLSYRRYLAKANPSQQNGSSKSKVMAMATLPDIKQGSSFVVTARNSVVTTTLPSPLSRTQLQSVSCSPLQYPSDYIYANSMSKQLSCMVNYHHTSEYTLFLRSVSLFLLAMSFNYAEVCMDYVKPPFAGTVT